MSRDDVPAPLMPYLAAAERVMARCAELAKISASPDGIERTYLTPEHRAANERVIAWMRESGLQARQDAAGNVVGETAGGREHTLILGSHLDTVPNAGAYDGILGVLLALEAAGQQRSLPFDLEVIGFGEEEGVRFGTTLMTSRARAGAWDDAWWQLRDADGVSLAQAANSFGLDPNAIGEACPDKHLLGYLEVHIEQGPVLEQHDLPVGVVTGIAAARRYDIELHGQAGHAGTVPLHMRRDPMLGAGHAIVAVRALAEELDMVATVGRLQAHPGGVNVIASRVVFSLDARSLEEARLEAFERRFEAVLQDLAEQEKLSFEMRTTHQAGAAVSAPRLRSALSRGVTAVGLPVHELSSGAGHDAMVMARLTDTGMLFVRCAGGISHNPRESVTVTDVAWALAVLTETLNILAEEYDQ